MFCFFLLLLLLLLLLLSFLTKNKSPSLKICDSPLGRAPSEAAAPSRTSHKSPACGACAPGSVDGKCRETKWTPTGQISWNTPAKPKTKVDQKVYLGVGWGCKSSLFWICDKMRALKNCGFPCGVPLNPLQKGYRHLKTLCTHTHTRHLASSSSRVRVLLISVSGPLVLEDLDAPGRCWELFCRTWNPTSHYFWRSLLLGDLPPPPSGPIKNQPEVSESELQTTHWEVFGCLMMSAAKP